MALVSTPEAMPIAGPGPSTMMAAAAKKTSRSLSRSSASDAQPRPVSILRKPSLPNLSTTSLPPLPSMSSTTSPSPFAVTAFPPLPPLPTLPASANSQRKSAPASTSAAAPRPRVRTTRSRVSFREDVDVATDKRGTSRPYSHGPTASSPLVPPMAKRPSADGDLGMRKSIAASSCSVPRPAIKRAVSASTALRPLAASTSTDDDFDAFRPLALRYPRASPALARLSDCGISTVPEVWSGVSGHLTASPPPISPLVVPSPAPVSLPTPASQRERSPSTSSAISPATLATPAKKTRAPRSPIPSWSSTCPSLTSSHRASLASTLTAPSVTSLLLTPHSQHEEHPLPTHSAYLDEHGMGLSPKPPQRDSTDMSDFETFAKSIKTREGLEMTPGDSKPRALQPAARLKPRRSEPAPSSFNMPEGQSPSSTQQVPRASERLLRLQSSLADLRMQRKASASPEKKPKSKSQNTSSSSGTATPEKTRRTAASNTPQQPPSPTVADLKRHTSSRMSKAALRKQEEMENLEDSGDESDLDLSLPLLNAALRSHVIPSSSRLLTTRKNRQSKAESEDAADKFGWSGSDSEEEEFSRTVARIAARKSGTFAARSLTKRPSLPAGRLSRNSRLPQFGAAASSDGRSSPSSSLGGPPTPFISERPSTSLGMSRTTNATAELLNALGKKYALPEELPRPKRFIGGWGAPEVLIDDEWPEAEGYEA